MLGVNPGPCTSNGLHSWATSQPCVSVCNDSSHVLTNVASLYGICLTSEPLKLFPPSSWDHLSFQLCGRLRQENHKLMRPSLNNNVCVHVCTHLQVCVNAHVSACTGQKSAKDVSYPELSTRVSHWLRTQWIIKWKDKGGQLSKERKNCMLKFQRCTLKMSILYYKGICICINLLVIPWTSNIIAIG